MNYILHSRICLGIIGDRLEPSDMQIPPYLIPQSALAETSKNPDKRGKINWGRLELKSYPKS
jgi:hypothetical protein